MATEVEVEQLFESLRPRIAEIKGRDVGLRGGGNLGCLLMVLPFAAAVGILMMLNDPGASKALWGWPLLAAPVIGVVVFIVGWKLWRPWSSANGAQRAEADSALRQPLAALLLPGATFTRASIMLSRYHSSLLMPRPDGVTSTSCGRIEGQLLGRPVKIDEMLLQSGRNKPIGHCRVGFEVRNGPAGADSLRHVGGASESDRQIDLQQQVQANSLRVVERSGAR